MSNGTIKASVDPLTMRYYEMKGAEGIPEIEILKYDVTDEVYETIKWKADQSQLLNWTLRGQVVGGKSTAGIHLVEFMNNHLTIIGKHKKLPDMKDLILADNSELLRFHEKKLSNVCIVIDEYNTMSETGLSATTEARWFEYQSDVFAQQMWHRIQCTPTMIVDRNTDIILETMGINKEHQTTICKVIYREPITGQLILLGTARFKVTSTINAPYYKNYRRKKFFRMELLQKHGIANYKEFEWSEIIMEAYDRVKGICTRRKPSNSLITGEIKTLKYEKSKQFSILNVDDLVRDVDCLVGLTYEIWKIRKSLKKKFDITEEHKKIEKSGIELNEEDIKEQLNHEEYQEVKELRQYKETLARQIMRHTKILEVFEKYKKIMVDKK